VRRERGAAGNCTKERRRTKLQYGSEKNKTKKPLLHFLFFGIPERKKRENERENLKEKN